MPISFDMYQILEDNLKIFCTDRYLIQMQSQAKSSGNQIARLMAALTSRMRVRMDGQELSYSPQLP